MKDNIKYDHIIYVEEYGNDDNDGLSKSKPIKTMKKAYEILYTKLLGKRVLIKLGRGEFTIDKASKYSEDSEGSCGYILMYNSTIQGEGLSTKLIVNANDCHGITYEGRQYYIKQDDTNCILCDMMIEINAPEYSGQYSNALFVWCRGNVKNIIFLINTRNMSYAYFNGGHSDNPCVENCMFIGDYTVFNDYSGSPGYKNCVFAHNPINHSTYYNNIELSQEQHTKLYNIIKNQSKSITVKDLDFDNNVGVLYGDYAWIMNYFAMKKDELYYVIKDNLLTNIDTDKNFNLIKETANRPSDFIPFIKGDKFNLIMIQ